MRFVLLFLLFLGSCCGHALAWGDTAHQVICEVAFRLTKPATQVEIQRLINSDPSATFPDFSESCVFPDHPRIRAPSVQMSNLICGDSDLKDAIEVSQDRHRYLLEFPVDQEILTALS
jgi:hypothetical protein